MGKSTAQVQQVLKDAVKFVDVVQTFLTGDYTTEWNDFRDAITANDGTADPEEDEMLAALDEVNELAKTFRTGVRDAFRSIHKTLGRYASNSDLSDLRDNMSAFHSKLVDDGDTIDSRGFTKFSSWSAGGSNVGNGTAAVFNNNPSSTSMDISHIDTLSLTCTRDYLGGTQRGREEFQFTGTVAPDDTWTDGGVGQSNSYDEPAFGRDDLFDASVPILSAGSTIESISAANGNGNILDAGDFVGSAASASQPIASWNTESGSNDLSYETTNVLKQNLTSNAQSLKAVGNFVISQRVDTKGANTRPVGLRPYFLEAYARVNANVTAGTVTFKVKDDSTTHATITQDTTSLTNDTWTKLTGVAFVLPGNVGTSLRVEIELTGYAGSDELLVDHVVLAPMTVMDAGRAAVVVEGVTDWRVNDVFTGATTSTDAGKNQKYLNTEMGVWVEHGTASAGWEDGA